MCDVLRCLECDGVFFYHDLVSRSYFCCRYEFCVVKYDDNNEDNDNADYDIAVMD